MLYIIPHNEGQELNYVESFDGTLSQAKQKAKIMADGLQRVLKQADISVQIQDSQTLRELAWVKARQVI